MNTNTAFAKNLLIIAIIFGVIVAICSTFETNLLPPTSVFFDAAQFQFGELLGYVASGTRFGVAFSLFCIAYVKLIMIADHNSEALKLRARTISLMFMVTATWTSTIAMMIEFGGMWHLVSMAFGLVELTMSIYTVSMVLQTHRDAMLENHD